MSNFESFNWSDVMNLNEAVLERGLVCEGFSNLLFILGLGLAYRPVGVICWRIVCIVLESGDVIIWSWRSEVRFEFGWVGGIGRSAVWVNYVIVAGWIVLCSAKFRSSSEESGLSPKRLGDGNGTRVRP